MRERLGGGGEHYIPRLALCCLHQPTQIAGVMTYRMRFKNQYPQSSSFSLTVIPVWG